MRHLTSTIVVLLICGIIGCQQAAEEQQSRSPIYDESADARLDIETAIDEASRDGKHILLMFGGNWCGWCHALHGLFQSDQEVCRLLKESYVLVMVDVGNRDKNLDLDERYGNPYRHGFPVLVVLDGKGRQLATRETGGLERQDGDRGHDPDKVLAFLQRWAPPRSSAFASGEWQAISSPTQAGLRGLCVCGDAAWASGGSGTFLHTIDHGRSWQAGTVAGAEALDFRDVHCWDQERAILLSAGSPAAIYKTEDGGTTWRRTFFDDSPQIFFNGMAYWDDSNGIAVGDPIDGKFVVITTVDGGESWRALPPENLPPALAGEANFAASGTCLAVYGTDMVWFGTGGPTARVFRSTDHGATWSVAETPLRSGESSQGVFSLYFSDDQNGIAVGGDFQDIGNPLDNAALTSDGGATWSVAPAPPAGFRECVVPVSRQTPWLLMAVGPSGADVSFDHGRTWNAAGALALHAAAFTTDGSRGWAVGAGGQVATWMIQETSPEPSR
jgi:photosystem II stability/assembly factor-like uncharacterized protein/thioredoxin-related protein